MSMTMAHDEDPDEQLNLYGGIFHRKENKGDERGRPVTP